MNEDHIRTTTCEITKNTIKTQMKFNKQKKNS